MSEVVYRSQVCNELVLLEANSVSSFEMTTDGLTPYRSGILI